jgi:hypothetical protein
MRVHSMFAASIVAVGLVLSVSTPNAAAQAAEVTEGQIAAARTAADHEVIAASYDAEAKAAEAKAAEHELMAKAYQGAVGMKGSRDALMSHCNRLGANYRAAAKEYRSLATEHRAMAKTAGK